MGRALQSKDISPLLPQGVLSNRIVAAFATFKKDTTLKRQGTFTLSTLQGSACAGKRLKESNDTGPGKLGKAPKITRILVGVSLVNLL